MLYLVTSLFFGVAFVAGQECNFGDLETFVGFDPEKYLGTWYEHYRSPNPEEESYVGCEFDQYFKSDIGISVLSVAYSKPAVRSFEVSSGIIANYTDNTFFLQYFNDPTWSSEYTVLGTDYTTYSIVGGCLGNSDPLVWIASHEKEMTDEGKESVVAILEKMNLNIDDLETVDQSFC
ncbi:hypothetical protein L9F63_023803 [Diploptera punctata]|uniref:Lipocalin/cytosolic fatty-acid binding domain-containing protein n=1 Tax=Diploptera punctata TaxID=6984 RepID=A0AAD7ZID7_DIPPU|nr:hypothetical protein L9F63_023803 [Diploptera punctata]